MFAYNREMIIITIFIIVYKNDLNQHQLKIIFKILTVAILSIVN